MNFNQERPRAWSSGNLAKGMIKSEPGDFIVDELLGFPLTGEGEHCFLKIRKTGQNTHWVAQEIARQVGLKPFEVGFAGRKDRMAITTQWFSLPAVKANRLDVSAIAGCELIESSLHQRKLRPGDHSGNQFIIRVRKLQGSDTDIEPGLRSIQEQGFPNYFGAQRFGREGGNLDKGWQLVSRSGSARGRDKGIYLSALRSWLFNQILASHIKAGKWSDICAAQEEWTGVLWGRGKNHPLPQVEDIENAVVEVNRELCEALEFTGLKQERRSLRARAGNFAYDWEASDCLLLRFALTPGQFATELLAELVEIGLGKD